jgi:hypothetical protein
MDSSEIEKAEFEHKLKVRQIILDKMLWGVVVIILGITANIVLERYKANLTNEKFFIEKKFDAVLNIQDAFSELLGKFERFTLTDERFGLPKDYSQIYADSLSNFVIKLNKSHLLLSEDFKQCAQYFIFIFSGFNQKDISKCRNYREFAYDVSGWFNEALLRELGFKSTFEKGDYQFKGLEFKLTHRVDREIGTAKFLDDEFDKWQKWQKNLKVN